MMHHFREHCIYAEITGFRSIEFARAEGLLKLNRKEKPQDGNVQFFNAQLIASSEHLVFAVLNALEAFKNKTNISKSLAMETMLYASAQRQIQKAIDFLGIKPQSKKMAMVVISEHPDNIKAMLKHVSSILQAKPDDSVLNLTKEKIVKIQKAYSITSKMLNAVANLQDQERATVNLVIERVALLSTQL